MIKKNGNLLITGNCWYEIIGLKSLLSARYREITCIQLKSLNGQDSFEHAIIALSDEPLVTWWGNLPYIFELRKRISGSMIVLVPKTLNKIKVLNGICQICDGQGELHKLHDEIIKLTAERQLSTSFRLTKGQVELLKSVSSNTLNIKKNRRWFYYHCSKLAKNVGILKHPKLMMIGLNRGCDYFGENVNEK